MIIRFFNLEGPDGVERLMIGFETPDSDLGQRREAVRAATHEDEANYPQAKAEYTALGALAPAPGPEAAPE
jgi:ribosomal 50S subunit-associated protein YjgA (DUF615 family)